MDVIVQLSPDVARAFQEHSPPPAEAREILDAMQRAGAALEPLHPASGDPQLDTYFRVSVPDQAAAQSVLDALKGKNAVKAAYLKPPEGPP